LPGALEIHKKFKKPKTFASCIFCNLVSTKNMKHVHRETSDDCLLINDLLGTWFMSFRPDELG
jgi:hypothetical protein